jgi:hypothetical protein
MIEAVRIYNRGKLKYISKQEYSSMMSLYSPYWIGDVLRDGNSLAIGPIFGIFKGGKIAMFFDKLKYTKRVKINEC